MLKSSTAFQILVWYFINAEKNSQTHGDGCLTNACLQTTVMKKEKMNKIRFALNNPPVRNSKPQFPCGLAYEHKTKRNVTNHAAI